MEPNQHLLNAGIELMLAGMGTVFLFLTLLVGATLLMSSLVQRWFAPATPPPTDPTPAEVAAISAAIHQHRSSSNKS